MINLARIQEKMNSLKDWSLEGNMITKEFEFKDFKKAIEFVNKVAEIAEKNNHHPDILINYNIVRIMLTTHSEKGLSDKDFSVAVEIDKL